MIYFLMYPIALVFFRVLLLACGRLRSEGEHNVPRTGPVLYCPNHLSDMDPPTLFVTVPRRAWYVAKDDLETMPVLGQILKHCRVIFIKRDSADRRALRLCENVLRRGEPLVIFPEGRCAQAGRLLPIQPGAVMLSIRTGAPIVPIGLRNTNKVLPYGEVRPRFSPSPVRVIFGKPIDPKDYAHLKKSAAMTAMQSALTNALVSLSGLEQAKNGDPAPPEAPGPISEECSLDRPASHPAK